MTQQRQSLPSSESEPDEDESDQEEEEKIPISSPPLTKKHQHSSSVVISNSSNSSLQLRQFADALLSEESPRDAATSRKRLTRKPGDVPAVLDNWTDAEMLISSSSSTTKQKKQKVLSKKKRRQQQSSSEDDDDESSSEDERLLPKSSKPHYASSYRSSMTTRSVVSKILGESTSSQDEEDEANNENEQALKTHLAAIARKKKQKKQQQSSQRSSQSKKKIRVQQTMLSDSDVDDPIKNAVTMHDNSSPVQHLHSTDASDRNSSGIVRQFTDSILNVLSVLWKHREQYRWLRWTLVISLCMLLLCWIIMALVAFHRATRISIEQQQQTVIASHGKQQQQQQSLTSNKRQQQQQHYSKLRFRRVFQVSTESSKQQQIGIDNDDENTESDPQDKLQQLEYPNDGDDSGSTHKPYVDWVYPSAEQASPPSMMHLNAASVIDYNLCCTFRLVEQHYRTSSSYSAVGGAVPVHICSNNEEKFDADRTDDTTISVNTSSSNDQMDCVLDEEKLFVRQTRERLLRSLCPLDDVTLTCRQQLNSSSPIHKEIVLV